MDGKFILPVSDVPGPNMDDVPMGDPDAGYRPPTIGKGLLDIASWFDIYDDRCGYRGDRSVQRDLRQWALRLMDVPTDVDEEILKEAKDICKFCGSKESPMWWKCCPKHCSEGGPDVICQTCYIQKHPEEAAKNGLFNGDI